MTTWIFLSFIDRVFSCPSWVFYQLIKVYMYRGPKTENPWSTWGAGWSHHLIQPSPLLLRNPDSDLGCCKSFHIGGDFSKPHRDHIGPRAGSQLDQSNHHQIVIPLSSTGEILQSPHPDFKPAGFSDKFKSNENCFHRLWLLWLDLQFISAKCTGPLVLPLSCCR